MAHLSGFDGSITAVAGHGLEGFTAAVVHFDVETDQTVIEAVAKGEPWYTTFGGVKRWMANVKSLVQGDCDASKLLPGIVTGQTIKFNFKSTTGNFAGTGRVARITVRSPPTGLVEADMVLVGDENGVTQAAF